MMEYFCHTGKSLRLVGNRVKNWTLSEEGPSKGPYDSRVYYHEYIVGLNV